MNKEFFSAEDCDVKGETHKTVTTNGYGIAWSQAISLEVANAKAVPLLQAIEVMRDALVKYSYSYVTVSCESIRDEKVFKPQEHNPDWAREALSRVDEILGEGK